MTSYKVEFKNDIDLRQYDNELEYYFNESFGEQYVYHRVIAKNKLLCRINEKKKAETVGYFERLLNGNKSSVGEPLTRNIVYT